MIQKTQASEKDLLLELVEVCHAYGGDATLNKISLKVARGEIVAVLGPSGCGKSTLLRAIAGLESVTAGEIRLEGEVVSRRNLTLAPERRGVGLVFQDYALFPHLNVLDNVLFGLRHRLFGRSAKPVEDRARAIGLLERVGLAHRAHSSPHTLSGGQQQRVALARALAPRPRLLLLDEPFSGLDSALRESVRNETMEVLRESGCAAVVVTHDPDEAMAIADRVVVLSEGRIEHDGSPASVYFEPRSLFVAKFLGGQNVLEGSFARNFQAPGATIGSRFLPIDPSRFNTSLALLDSAVTLVVRPEGVQISDTSCLEREAPAATPLSAGNEQQRTVEFRAVARSARWLGHEVVVTLESEEICAPLVARVPGARWRSLARAWEAEKERTFFVTLAPEAVHAFSSTRSTEAL